MTQTPMLDLTRRILTAWLPPEEPAMGSQGTDPAAAQRGAHDVTGPVEEVTEPGFARALVL